MKNEDKDLETIEKIMDLLLGLSHEERLEIFSNFCMGCGINNPKCQCWNDE